MYRIKKNIPFFMLFFLPYSLYSWGDVDKLNGGGCQYDKETGYSGSSLYTKGNDAYMIVDVTDGRYGTTSTVYNAITCEKVTSGNKSESNYEALMLRKGFVKTNLNSKYMVDKSFHNKISFTDNHNELIVHNEAIDPSTSQEITRLLSSISDKSASSQITISNAAQEFLGYETFYTLFLEKLNTLPPEEINYDYALALNTKLGVDTASRGSSKNMLLGKQEEMKARIAKLEAEAKVRLVRLNEEVKNANKAKKYRELLREYSSRKFVKNIPIPDKFLVKTSSGCGAFNPVPKANESIEWTGKCVNGKIDGFGTLTWYKNGKKGTVDTGQHFRNGIKLKISHDDWEDHMITSYKDKKCGFVMPSSIALSENSASKLMDVEFEGGCGEGYEGKVNIFFNNEFFATYRGKLARGNKLPVNGELEYFSGDVYKMGSDPQGYLTSGAMIRGWYDEAHLVSSGKTDSGLSDNNFKIKIGFNTKPTSVKSEYGKLIGFDIRALSSANNIVLKYNVKPKNRKKLTKKQYTMTIEVKMDYTKTGSIGFMSMSEDKVVYDYVQIVLKKSNGYKAYGESKLRKMSTFQRALGVNMTKSNFRPSVRVVSID